MDLSNIRILVVDDEEDLLEMYKDLLELEGFKVDTVPSAKKAIEVLSSTYYQVIISDSYMPEMTGLDFLDQIRPDPNKVLFYLSTGAAQQSLADLTSKGATGLFLKPFDLDEVVAKIISDLKLKNLL